MLRTGAGPTCLDAAGPGSSCRTHGDSGCSCPSSSFSATHGAQMYIASFHEAECPMPTCFHGGVTEQVGFVSGLTSCYCPQRRWRSFGPTVCCFVSAFYRHHLRPAQSCASGQRTICFPRGASDRFP